MSYLSINSPKVNFADWFRETPLGIRLGAMTEAIWRMGSLDRVAAGDVLVSRGCTDHVLHVVLMGRLNDSITWYGPGNHIGSAAILHGRAAADDIVASEDCTVWTLRMDSPLWRRGSSPAAELLMQVMEMLELLPRNRPAPPRPVSDAHAFCDVDHPLIRQTAATLRRDNDSDTAAAIWAHVREMPYRFGAWQEPASQTLARGTGMCTTKSNVQVALARACGLEAGYVEVGLEMSVLGLLIPDMWRYVMRPKVRHYFAAVKLDGRWHASDATYNGDCMDIFAQANPVLYQLQPYRFGVNEPFNPGAFVTSEDPFAIEVRPDLAHEMSKRSRFEAHHFESLNTRLDQAQGLLRMPQLAQDPEAPRVAGLTA